MAERVSNTHEYKGYSKEIYNGYQVFSQYLTMHDGVKVAIDIYRPTNNGILHEEKLPVIWCATPYRRAIIEPDGKRTPLNNNLWFAPSDIESILFHGYIVAALDSRGNGASYGNAILQCSLDEAYDYYDVNEWLASQEWCSGKTGMFGCSYLGDTQMYCAMMAPPSLKCIVPNGAAFELPKFTINGVRNMLQYKYIDQVMYPKNVVDVAVAVDEDTDGSMIREVSEIHKNNPSNYKAREDMKYSDSFLDYTHRKIYDECYLPKYLNNFNNSGIAVYIWGSWKDLTSATDQIMLYNNLKVPKRIVMGNWFHPGYFIPDAPNWKVEHLRWYDYWLKGIDNGIMDEPPMILCNTVVSDDITTDVDSRHIGRLSDSLVVREEHEWKQTYSWPESEMRMENFYFNNKQSKTVASLNDGSLTEKKPEDINAKDVYTVDYTVTKVGLVDRMSYNVMGSQDYTPFDEKSTTYTTAPFAEDTKLSGFPLMELWVSIPVKRLDFYVTLEEIDQNGVSHYLTDGKLSTACRGTVDPPYDYMNLPYHRNHKRDQQDMPINTPVKLEFALSPLMNTIKAGNRLRVTINHCDRDRWELNEIIPAPEVTIYRSTDLPSLIKLPIVR